MKTEHKTILVCVTITLILFAAVALYTTPPTTYLETYRGFNIYTIDGNNITFLIVHSPFNDKNRLYLDLELLKLDLDTEESEFDYP